TETRHHRGMRDVFFSTSVVSCLCVKKSLFSLVLSVVATSFVFAEGSETYLSGDTWRGFCDWRVAKKEKQTVIPEKVKEGDTIFVKYDQLERFQTQFLHRIKNRFILISPNSGSGADNPLPGKFAPLLSSEKIAAWFVQNIDRAPSEKVIPLPIGIANHGWEHGNTALLDKYRSLAKKIEARKTGIYVNFSVQTNPQEREPCFQYFSKLKGAKVAGSRSFEEYLQDLSDSVFVVSPPGHGLDCHRTWEALLMGCYPIVKHSTLDPLFEDLPVVLVSDWSEVTEQFLEEKKKEFSQKQWKMEKLLAPYWFEKVKAVSHAIKRGRSDE
ncbi:MAG: hypothetical protein ACHQT8_07980, partial [Chlamydiales bacterium]